MNGLAKIKNLFGRVYRSMWGIFYNKFDKVVEPKQSTEFQVIGKSVEGRNIMCYQLGEGHKSILFVGGIHGNETGTVKLVYRIVKWLEENKKIFENSLKIFCIPCLNPDGFEVAQNNPDYMNNGWTGRLNANKVDLNRNFPTENFRQHCYWQRGKAYSQREEVYCGTHGASEPETKALVDFVLSRDIKLVIALHNVGGDIFVDDQDVLTKELAGMYQILTKKYFSFESIFPKLKRFQIKGGVVYPADLSEWAKQNRIHWMVVEGSNRWGSDWGVQGKAIEGAIRELAEKEF